MVSEGPRCAFGLPGSCLSPNAPPKAAGVYQFDEGNPNAHLGKEAKTLRRPPRCNENTQKKAKTSRNFGGDTPTSSKSTPNLPGPQRPNTWGARAPVEGARASRTPKIHKKERVLALSQNNNPKQMSFRLSECASVEDDTKRVQSALCTRMRTVFHAIRLGPKTSVCREVCHCHVYCIRL